jgi:hypothetical protein
MKTEYQIILIIFIHWVADFLLQTKTMATNKSKNNYWLFTHVFVYSLTWFIIGISMFDLKPVIQFTVLTFIFHFTTDYFTSRWTNKLYKRKKYYGFPSFFSVIGLDQFLHYLQLIVCYEILF